MSVKQPSTEQRRPSRGIVRSGVAESLFRGPGEDELRVAVERGLEDVEERLRAEVRYAEEIAEDVTSHLMTAGGKRMRPMLALLTSFTGPEPVSETAITAAAAVEITHLASLYHDDVMDEAELRRGVTAAHLNWGNSIAILAGDLLFARSSLMFTDLGPVYIRLQSRTFERLVLGQMRETVGPREGDDRIEHYVQVLADKTGSLIAAAAQFGAMSAGAGDDVVAALAAYGEGVGVAFQIVDDVIDLSADRSATGKVAGTDLRAGVETLPVLLLERRAADDPAAADLLGRIRDRVAGAAAESPEVAEIVAELRAHEVSQATLDEASAWVDRAIAALAPLPDGAVKDALERFAGDVVARDR